MILIICEFFCAGIVIVAGNDCNELATIGAIAYVIQQNRVEKQHTKKKKKKKETTQTKQNKKEFSNVKERV